MDNNLKKFRKSHDLTQQDVAEKVGISLTAYRDLETGKTQLMNDKMVKIADAVGVSLEELVIGYKPSPENSKLLEEQKIKYEDEIRQLKQSVEENITNLQKMLTLKEEIIKQMQEVIDSKNQLIDFLKSNPPQISENLEKMSQKLQEVIDAKDQLIAYLESKHQRKA